MWVVSCITSLHNIMAPQKLKSRQNQTAWPKSALLFSQIWPPKISTFMRNQNGSEPWHKALYVHAHKLKSSKLKSWINSKVQTQIRKKIEPKFWASIQSALPQFNLLLNCCMMNHCIKDKHSYLYLYFSYFCNLIEATFFVHY